MYQLKTKLNDASVEKFLNGIEDEKRRQDCYEVLDIMREVTGYEPKMWGASIVGFGSYHYKYASGHEGDSCLTGFSPRKANITLYLMAGGFEQMSALLDKLGKHKTGKGCLYINKMEDVNKKVLKELIGKCNKKLKEFADSRNTAK